MFTGVFVIGVTLIVVCVLVQIPAVLLLARYCERDDDVPPSVRFWQTGDRKPPYDAGDASGDAPDTAGATPGQAPVDPDGDRIRCRRCRAINGDTYRYCRSCLAELR